MDEQNIPEIKQPVILPTPILPEKRPKNNKVVFLIIGIIVLILLIARNLVYAGLPVNANDYDPITLQPKKISVFKTIKNIIFNTNEILEGQKDDRINILLLGIGGQGHDGPYLSDTNIIISIKPNTNQVALISIPRDLMVKIGKYGYRKINFADAYGEMEKPGNGGEYARQIFEQTLNIKIPYYARVDFKAFADLIDAVGGVTINIPKSFTDSQYPGPNDSYQTVSFTAGSEQMNGERALVYARSRHGTNGEGSDFARSKRQQMVLSALKQKIMSANTLFNPIKIQQILSSISNHTSTNLDFGQIMYLFNISKQLDTTNIKNLVIDDSPNGFLKPIIGDSGAYLLTPKTGNFENINNAIKYVFDATTTLFYDTTTTTTPSVIIPNSGTTVAQNVKIEIQNGTWRVGMAAKLKQKLEEQGMSISYVGNTVKKPINNTVAYIIAKNVPKEIINVLQTQLKLSVQTVLPEWLNTNYDDPGTLANEAGPKYNTNTGILIVLGDDANY